MQIKHMNVEAMEMKLSEKCKKGMISFVGCFLITAVLMEYIGILNAIQVGIGMLLIIIGIIRTGMN